MHRQNNNIITLQSNSVNKRPSKLVLKKLLLRDLENVVGGAPCPCISHHC